jgi:hypothetical protein
MAGGLVWQAWDGKLCKHGSWRPGIPSHRIGVRKSASGAAACSITERWRCGRSSRRASMMPILSGWSRQTYATTLLRNVKGKMGTMAALRVRKIILASRHKASRSQGKERLDQFVRSFCAPYCAKTRLRGVSGMNSSPALLRKVAPRCPPAPSGPAFLRSRRPLRLAAGAAGRLAGTSPGKSPTPRRKDQRLSRLKIGKRVASLRQRCRVPVRRGPPCGVAADRR